MEKLNKFIKSDVPSIFGQIRTYIKVYFWTIVVFVFVVGLIYIIQYVSGYHIAIIKNIISPVGGK